MQTVSELAPHLEALRKQGKRIVLCHGVFDLLHIGHIRYLRQARKLGDVLVVTVTPDRYVDKGPHRPAFGEQLRVEAVGALDCVDYAALNEWPTAEESLRLLKPHVYAKGSEFKNLEDPTGKIAREAAVAQAVGAKVVFVEDVVFSSSSLINRYLSTFSEECQEYMALFRQRHSLEEIFGYLDSLRGLKVLVLGDMILDEYIYCSSLGASSKDPVLALHHQSQETFAGGAAAVANHVAQHGADVTLCTVLGDDGYEDFVREKLDPRVQLRHLQRPGAPTLRKQRIMDSYSFQKLIEVYHMGSDPLTPVLENQLCHLLEQLLGEHDMVVAADFGHGCITTRMVDLLNHKAPFLAVNTQANAGNRGFHTISRYARADFVSLALHEIRLEYRNHQFSLGEMMGDLKQSLGCGTMLVTEGRKGCAVLQEDFIRVPSFAANTVDRVGTGDALFSLAALGAHKGFPADVLGFCGNIVGSLAAETLGNAKAVGHDTIRKFITAVMK